MKRGDENIPRHVAIIMDGNRRWAKNKGLPVVAGHKKVVEEMVERLVEKAVENKIEYITLWAFSTENWGRAEMEIKGVMRLFRWALEKRGDRLIKKGARVRMIGDLGRFPKDIQKGFEKMTEKSKQNDKIVVTFALNYGGRDELLRAIHQMTNDKLQITDIDEETVSKYLDTVGMPDPDLIIRTGGEQRMSGFMSWQGAYSEYYFTKVLMPDFDEEEFEKAIEEYKRRQRRFGKG